jgi:hypothetical protein
MSRARIALALHAPPDLRTLHVAPELTAVDTLLVVIERTLDALRVANPLLLTPVRFDGHEYLTPQLWIARQVEAHAEPLQRALEHYRRAIENGPARSFLPPPDDSDLPF